jgi:hypothetical protein
VFLELKERDGACSRKRRTALSATEAAHLFAALAQPDAAATRKACDVLARADGAREAVLRELADTRRALAAALEPSCVVRYRRDAFQDTRSALRVTFDRDIEVFRAPSSPFDDAALGRPVLRQAECVIEAKSTGALPSWLIALFGAHGAHAAEYSKLVMASRAVHGAL